MLRRKSHGERLSRSDWPPRRHTLSFHLDPDMRRIVRLLFLLAALLVTLAAVVPAVALVTERLPPEHAAPPIRRPATR